MGTKNKVSEGDVRNYVEKQLLYKQTQKMRVVTSSTVENWLAYKIRTLFQKINAALSDPQFPADEDTQDAINYLKGKHGH